MSAQDPIKITAYINSSSAQKWQSIIVSPIENYLDSPYKGRLFGVLKLTVEGEFDTAATGGMLRDILIGTYYDIDKHSIIDLLEETLKRTKEKLIEILTTSENAPSQADFECTILSIRDNIIYTAAFGNSDLFLFSKHKKIDLGEFQKDSSGRNEVKVLSAILKDNDRVLLSTANSLNRIIDTKLLELVNGFDIESLANQDRISLPDSCILLIGYKLELEETPKIAAEKKSFFKPNVRSFLKRQPAAIKPEVEAKAEFSDEEEYIDPKVPQEMDNFEQKIDENAGRDSESEVEINNNLPQEDPDSQFNLENEELSQPDEFQNEQESELPSRNNSSHDFNETQNEKVDSEVKPSKKFLKKNLSADFSKIKAGLGNFINSFKKKAPRNSVESSNFKQTTFIVLLSKLGVFIKEKFIALKNALLTLIYSRKKIAPMYVKRGASRKALIPIVIAIIIVGGILFFSIRQISIENDNKALTAKSQSLVDEAAKISSDAKSSVLLNRQRSRELISQSNVKLADAQKTGKLGNKINEIKKTNESISMEIDKIIPLADSNIIADFGLTFPDAKLLNVFVTSKEIIVVASNKTLLLSSKTNINFAKQTITDTKITKIDAASIDGSGKLILYDGENGLFTYSIEDKALEKLAGLSNTVLGSISAMTSYKSGKSEYLYTLRKDDGTVNRLTKLANGYSQPEIRLSDKVFENATDIDVDGRIYVTAKNSISRYLGSNIDKYSLDNSGLSPLPENLKITALDSNYAYMSDNNNNRIIITNKGEQSSSTKITFIASLIYKGTYPKFEQIMDISSDKTNLFILDAKRLYNYTIEIPQGFLSN